jgi:hypothetical protein
MGTGSLTGPLDAHPTNAAMDVATPVIVRTSGRGAPFVMGERDRAMNR